MICKTLATFLVLFLGVAASAAASKRNIIQLADRADTWTQEIRTPQSLRYPVAAKDWTALALLVRDLIDTFEGRQLISPDDPQSAQELAHLADVLEQECRWTRTSLTCATSYEGERLWNGELAVTFDTFRGEVRRIRSLKFSGSM